MPVPCRSCLHPAARTLLAVGAGALALALAGRDALAQETSDGAQTILLEAGVRHAYPRWWAGGTEILFQSDRDGPWRLCTLAADGSGLRVLTDGSASDNFPDGSPDGRAIAFVSDRDGNTEIYRMAADGSDVRRLTDDPGTDIHPYWTPDGSSILFNSTRADGKLQIFEMSADGGGTRRLVSSDDDDSCARVAPAGDRLLYLANLARGQDDVMLRARDGAAPQNLTNDAARDGWPTWTPDGRRIVFASQRAGAFALYVMDADGTHVRRLTDPPAGWADVRPAVSPDGRRLLFNRERGDTIGILVMPLPAEEARATGPGAGDRAASAAGPAGVTSTPAGEVDPVLGRWLGSTGTAHERVVLGLQFEHDAEGALRLHLTLPVLNTFGLLAPGTVSRHGDRVRLDELGLALELVGDRLEGSYPGPDSRASLARVDALPVELDPPAVPTGPAPRWRTRLGGTIYASPAVRDGVAYVGTTGGVFNAVGTADGALLWTHSAGRPIHGSALATEDAVYFASDGGHLFKLRRGDGAELWRYGLGDEHVGRVLPHPAVFAWDWQGATPVLADGIVYIGAGDGGFHAVDAAGGARRWRVQAGGRIRNGAAIDGGRVVFGSADGSVYALDRVRGDEVWRFDTGAEVDTTPVVHDGAILVGNRGAGLFALDAETGRPRWRTSFWGSWVESTPVVVDGVIYVGASDLRRVSALDAADGRVLWRTDVFGWTWGTPLVTADRVYAGAAGGEPYVFRHRASFTTLDRRTGAVLARWPLPDSGAHQWGIGGSPALSGDTIVVATLEGALWGFPAG